MRRGRWWRNHSEWMKIPYKDGENHVGKGEGSSYL
jgi:hypothetical protein